MTTWATTSYTRTADGLVESHRDLTPDELPAAVYAMEASTDGGRSYTANGLRWVDPEDAKTWASGLAMRWFGCTNIRVVRVTAPRDDPSPEAWYAQQHAACGCDDAAAHILPDAYRDAFPAYEVLEVVYQTL